MINWPEDLVSDIARRRSVLFLGAGVSKNSTNQNGERPMDWVEFLTHLSQLMDHGKQQEAVVKCIGSSDLLTACEIARKGLGDDKFKTELLRAFSEKRFRFASIHEDIVAIDSRIVLTTNFDKLYDTAANTILHGDIIIKSYTDSDIADIVRRQNRCIIKVHGTIDSPADTVLTRRDYAIARNAYAHFYRVIDALFMTHTFVFLGASMRDPDMALMMEDYALRYRGARPHYVVMPDDPALEAEMAVVQESLNLKAIKYDGANNHQELRDGVSELSQLVAEARARLLETMNW